MKVKPGLEQIRKVGSRFKGKKIALLTHRAAYTSDFQHAVDLFIENGLKPKLLLSPEHGIFSSKADGAMVGREVFKGIEVISIYDKRERVKEDLLDIEIIFVDLQDVGVRCYTYISALKDIMKAAGELGIKVVVLDRPNPLGGERVEGPVLDERYISYVGVAPIPFIHGLTIGEMGYLFKDMFKIDVDYEVFKMEGWKRDMYFDETGLPWIPPSPGLPCFENALSYPATVFFEGTNISEGRGTTRPFIVFGAPWINSIKLAEELNQKNLPGVYFIPAAFTPCASKYKDEKCEGVELLVFNKRKFTPIITIVTLFYELFQHYVEEIEWLVSKGNYWVDLLWGGDTFRTHLEAQAIETLFEEVGKGLDELKKIAQEVHLY